MSITVRLNKASGGDNLAEILGAPVDGVQVEAATVREAIEQLAQRFSKAQRLQQMLLDSSGKMRDLWIVCVNEEDIRFLQGLDTPLKDGDEVWISTAVCDLFLGVVAEGLKSDKQMQARPLPLPHVP